MGKKYTEYTVDDLIRLDLSFLLKDKTDDESKAQATAFSYLMNTANSCGINIREVKLLEEFGADGSTNSMVTDKGEINKRLFTRINEIKKADASNGAGFSLLEADKKAICEASLVDYGPLIRAEERLRASSQGELERYMRYVSQYTKTVREKSAKVAELEMKKLRGLTDDSTYKAIVEIITNPYWQYIGISSSGSVRFATTQYVTQELKNPAAGIDITVEYGIFFAEINLKDKKITAHPYSDNIIAHGNPHPHIHKEGSICWGNYNREVREYIGKDKWRSVMDVLAILLETYCGDNPFTAIESFYSYQQRLVEELEKEAGVVQPITDIYKHLFHTQSRESERVGTVLKKSTHMDVYRFPLSIVPERSIKIADTITNELHHSSVKDDPNYPLIPITGEITSNDADRLWIDYATDSTSNLYISSVEDGGRSSSVNVYRITGSNAPRDNFDRNRYIPERSYAGEGFYFKSIDDFMKAVQVRIDDPNQDTDRRTYENIIQAYNLVGVFLGCPMASIGTDGKVRWRGNLLNFNGNLHLDDALAGETSEFQTYRSWELTLHRVVGTTTRVIARVNAEAMYPLPIFGETKEEYEARFRKYVAYFKYNDTVRPSTEEGMQPIYKTLLSLWEAANPEAAQERVLRYTLPRLNSNRTSYVPLSEGL